MAINPAFRVSEEHAAAIAGIVRALDGVPLAIELAAARTRTMSPREILDAPRLRAESARRRRARPARAAADGAQHDRVERAAARRRGDRRVRGALGVLGTRSPSTRPRPCSAAIRRAGDGASRRSRRSSTRACSGSTSATACACSGCWCSCAPSRASARRPRQSPAAAQPHASDGSRTTWRSPAQAPMRMRAADQLGVDAAAGRRGGEPRPRSCGTCSTRRGSTRRRSTRGRCTCTCGSAVCSASSATG